MRSPPDARPQAVFFDLDETLVDNTQPMQQLFVQVFEQYFPDSVVEGRINEDIARVLKAEVFALWESIFDRVENGAIATLFHETLKQCQLNTAAASDMANELTRSAANALRLRPGALEILARLRAAGIETGIITNGIEQMQMAKIQRFALQDKVDAVVVSERAGAHKPEAVVFEYALSKLDVSAKHAWHVGDHPLNDVTGAIACGMRGILYQPEDSKSERFTLDEKSLATPDLQVAHLLEIVDWLD